MTFNEDFMATFPVKHYSGADIFYTQNKLRSKKMKILGIHAILARQFW